MANRPRSSSMTDALRLRSAYGARLGETDPSQMLAAVSQTTQNRNGEYMASLPHLTDKDIAVLQLSDSSCPICIVSFLAILAEEEMATVMDSPAYAAEDLGVTKLDQTCGHVFCRKDIQNWLTSGHNSCPTCRRPLMSVAPDLSGLSSPLADLLNPTLAGGHDVESMQDRILNMVDQLDRLVDRASLVDRIDSEREHSHSSPGHTPDDYDDDRSHLSGMYS